MNCISSAGDPAPLRPAGGINQNLLNRACASTSTSTCNATANMDNFDIKVPLQPAEHPHRPSNISFERHFLAFEDFSRDVDEYDDDCSFSHTSAIESDRENSKNNQNTRQQHLQNTEKDDDLLNREIRADRRSSFTRFNSKISIDLENTLMAAVELEDEKQGEDENSSSSMNVSARFGSRHLSRTSNVTSSVVQMQEEIIAKAIESGKLEVSNSAGRCHQEGGSLSQGHKSSSSSWSSGTKLHRVSFARSIEFSAFEMCESKSSSAPSSNVRNEIMASIRELRSRLPKHLCGRIKEKDDKHQSPVAEKKGQHNGPGCKGD